jgi:cystathionine gamma-synthase
VLGRPKAAPGAPLSEPVTFASTYRAGEGPGYGRYGNPPWTALEEALGGLEGGTAVAFASGMGAIGAILDDLPPSGTVVAPADAYNTTRLLLADAEARGRLRVRLVDVTDAESTLAACEGAALLWVESPTNPLLGIADLDRLLAGAHERGAAVVVDNTMATPLLQTPLRKGADLVVHSVTKLLAGHADLVMGAAVARDPEQASALVARRSLSGAIPGPLESFLALRGLRTLPVRLERGQASAAEIARRLAGHPRVARVRYPGLSDHPGHDLATRQMRGFGTILVFEAEGGPEAAEAVCARARVIVHATSFGGVESLIERRARWPGEDATPPALLRLSVGCEHVEDIWADLAQALEA